MLYDRLALDTAAGADSTLDVRDASCLAIATEVMVGLDLVQVPHTVDVGRVEAEFIRLEEEPWEERQRNHEEQTEPIVRRMEEVVVVAVDRCGEPSGSNDGVGSLYIRLSALVYRAGVVHLPCMPRRAQCPGRQQRRSTRSKRGCLTR